MDVNPIHHLCLRPLVVVVVLDSVSHVLAYVAVLHLNVAPGKINGCEGVVVTIYDRQSERVTESDRE